MLKRIIILLFALAPALMQGAEPSNLDAAIEALDRALDKKKQYFEAYNKEIEDLKATIPHASDAREKARIAIEVAEKYYSFQIDSAISYFYRAGIMAQSAGDEPTRRLSQIRMASLLPVIGAARDAFQIYESIPSEQLSADEKAMYFQSANRMYSYAREFAFSDSLKRHYGARALEMSDSLQKYIPKNSAKYKLYHAQSLAWDGKMDMAEAEIREALGMLEPTDKLYGWASASLADIMQYTAGKTTDESLYFYVLAAIGDLEAYKRETTALQAVGNELAHRGDLDRAYRYLKEALTDAVDSRSSIRIVNASERFPFIADAVSDREHTMKRRLVTVCIVLVLLLIGMGVMLGYIIRDRKRRARMNVQLQKRHTDKDQYIANLLRIYSHFLERAEDVNRMAARKIVGGQVQELHKMLVSGKFMNEYTQYFHDTFDKAFRAAWPDFVEKVNALLLPDKQLAIDPDERFTPEVRILALMRVGVTESADLARFLGLAVNTVYTYRNRLKNRAINRDTFEATVMGLG